MAVAAADCVGRRAGATERWRTRAFGIEIDSSVPAPGLPHVAGAAAGAATRLDVVDSETIDAGWPAAEAERLLEERFGGATPARTIDFHPACGYRLYARYFGLASISPDGLRIACAPPPVAAWRWQRFLVGRVLPWAALLRGHELFHASAVRRGGVAVAFIGPSGLGKTSLALRLVLRGAGFVTDDVLALERFGGGLRAHPGAAICAVRPAERAALTRAQLRALGSVLGHSEKSYVALEREEQPLPLGVVYFLRAGSATHEQQIEPLAAPDPRLVLASTFVVSVQSPQRLLNHLGVCSELARAVPLFALTVDPALGSAALAEAVDRHLESIAAGGP